MYVDSRHAFTARQHNRRLQPPVVFEEAGMSTAASDDRLRQVGCLPPLVVVKATGQRLWHPGIQVAGRPTAASHRQRSSRCNDYDLQLSSRQQVEHPPPHIHGEVASMRLLGGDRTGKSSAASHPGRGGKLDACRVQLSSRRQQVWHPPPRIHSEAAVRSTAAQVLVRAAVICRLAFTARQQVQRLRRLVAFMEAGMTPVASSFRRGGRYGIRRLAFTARQHNRRLPPPVVFTEAGRSTAASDDRQGK